VTLVDSLVALFESAWRARPNDATGLRVSVGGRAEARVALRWQVARAPKESREECWRQYGVDREMYDRVARGSEPCSFAASDEAREPSARLSELADGVSRPVFLEEVKRAFALVRPRVGDAWLVVWRGGDEWDRQDQERFETLNPHWRPKL
jgi:hypothetical protein